MIAFLMSVPFSFLVSNIIILSTFHVLMNLLSRVSEVNEVPVSSHIWVTSTTLKKTEIIFYDHFETNLIIYNDEPV